MSKSAVKPKREFLRKGSTNRMNQGSQERTAGGNNKSKYKYYSDNFSNEN